MSELYSSKETEQSTPSEVYSDRFESHSVEITPHQELSSQEIAERTCSETMTQLTHEYGDIIPEEQLVRMDIENELYKPTVMSSKEYTQTFPENDPSVLGHCDGTGRIYLKDSSPEAIRHIVTHETMHRASFRETDDSQIGVETYRSGIREVVFQNGRVVEDSNQALNEGITELYSIQEMQRRGELSAIASFTAYPEACQKAYELHCIVGADTVQRAYFGGEKELLSSEIVRLNCGVPATWESYSSHIDTLEYGTDPKQIRESKKELTLLQSIMLANKEAAVHQRPIAELS